MLRSGARSSRPLVSGRKWAPKAAKSSQKQSHSLALLLGDQHFATEFDNCCCRSLLSARRSLPTTHRLAQETGMEIARLQKVAPLAWLAPPFLALLKLNQAQTRAAFI